ncbi:MAG: YggT family protein [Chloroflexi bacterium]|nr:YggT family protein [Chloroflexota bacterium]
MDAPLEPRRRVIREEAVYEPVEPVVQQPVVGVQQPVVGVQQPVVGVQQPVVGVQQPVVGVQQPVVGVQQPVYGVQQPVVHVQQPVMAAQPVAGVQQPVVSMQPTVAQPVVGVDPLTGQPVVGVQQQVAAQPVVFQQPVVAQPVMQTVLPQPVATAQTVFAVEPATGVDTQRSYSQVGDMRVENIRQGFYDANGNLVQREEQVLDDPYMRRMNKLDRAARIIYFVMGFLEVLLALRFLFRILGSDSSNGLVNFIYNFTGPFVAPFNGIFNDQNLQRASVIEISTLLAMALYAILTYGIIQLLYILFTPDRSSRSVFSSFRRRGL